jgi:REP element-mobilizing transposase RayT
MPRRQRIVIPNAAHHFMQIGNGNGVIFPGDTDCRVFLEILANYADRYGLSITGYCLLKERYHVVGVPARADAAARVFACLHADYARYYNLAHNSSGHLWQSRYDSAPMDNANCWRAVAWVERTAVARGLARTAEYYPWSSAAARLGLIPAPKWLDLERWQRAWSKEQWRGQLHDASEDAAFGDQLLAATRSGRMLGTIAADQAFTTAAAATRP